MTVLVLLLCGCAGTSTQGKPALAAVQANADDSGSAVVGSVEVQEAWIDPPPGRVYPPGSGVPIGLVLANNGSSWDSLTSVTTPAASRVTLTEYNIDQDFISLTTDPKEVQGIAQMEDITRTIAPGEDVPVTFHFRYAGSVTMQVPVRSEPQPAIGTG